MRKHLATALVLIITTAGIAACGGDDDDQSSGSPSTDESQVDTGDSSDTTDAPSGDLADLLERQKDAVIKVTYKRGDDEFTIAQDHEKRAITSGNSKVIVTDDGTINCDDLDTTPTCLDVPEGVDSLVNVGLSFYNVVAQSLADASGVLPGARDRTGRDRRPRGDVRRSGLERVPAGARREPRRTRAPVDERARLRRQRERLPARVLDRQGRDRQPDRDRGRPSRRPPTSSRRSVQLATPSSPRRTQCRS